MSLCVLEHTQPERLGAHLVEGGVSFSVSAPAATAVDLCLFEAGDPQTESARVRMKRDELGCWNATVLGAATGQLYGYRAHGPFDPESGALFNPAKLLLDPYSRAISGQARHHPSMNGVVRDEDGVLQPEPTDSAPAGLRSVVIDDSFDWQGTASPARTPWSDTIVYELHVKGFTKQLESVPEELRGTYAGLAHPAAIERLLELGVTAVQLLPVHQFLDDGFLLERGLTNYWGYNTLCFLAPHNDWAAASSPQDQVDEFKSMVKALHQAGLEVILDVVYNHTAEAGQEGPMLSMRGLDDGGYYCRAPKFPESYWDCTGCGNTVRVETPVALGLVLDSLRYWATEMRIDGFRFDLATVLGREKLSFTAEAAFFKAVAQDPVLSRVKMIAEPWDTGQADSYQVGEFPVPWREFNDRYRDTARRFWRGDPGLAGAMAGAFSGSERIMGHGKGGPLLGLNFITCHDGFTLRDLVSYDGKWNEANGENSRDGTDNNHSWSEQDPELRLRQQRNLLTTLFLSAGVPFLLAGDEMSRTQQGNNNGYCQDNEISWLDWDLDDEKRGLREFVSRLIAYRAQGAEFRRDTFLTGQVDAATGEHDVLWLDTQGKAMNREKWHGESRDSAFTAILAGRPTRLVLFNPGSESRFFLPGLRKVRWQRVIDTADPNGFLEPDEALRHRGGDSAIVKEKSLVVLELVVGNGADAQKLSSRPRKK